MMLTQEFLAFSAAIGSDPLQIQGPGGNTSIKDGNTLWIKASGMELADAEEKNIFVAVDLHKVKAKLDGNSGDNCTDALIDANIGLRPSIETLFHAALDWQVVAHSHSVATLVHVISPQGRQVARQKLADLQPVFVPYHKPGLPLTLAIMEVIRSDTRVILLENHGLICCGSSVAETQELMCEVESRLCMQPQFTTQNSPKLPAQTGFEWAEQASLLAQNDRLHNHITTGSYYPDHVVFLGPTFPTEPKAEFPAFVVPQLGVQIKQDASEAQKAMLRCLADIFSRLPEEWQPQAIGVDAELELLDWDAEKYRQALAARN